MRPLVAAMALALLSAGCSVSFPILGLSSKSEDEVATTSAILPARGGNRPAALASLSSELGPEDMRRADGAMGVALDPQGNGAAVSWDNPQNGIKGSFVPVGGPFLRSDEICRAFIASVQTQTRPVKLQGTACRPSGGEWAVKDVGPWKDLG
ncbi:RT0821/Lpp0805 family surface protein [Bosea sp. NBC_00550]|uniref:RT0821/Lpp0805 family surface protein n=1 Tax=Bosea sp. NBC_00550 TaxID=2969621 RepID=UPI00223035DA|nr:RT0821/Lpp0805 family surface protein [Bosea sp. NBC_00550]UZF95062.1 RT0821/Lpp0805 family surface protein [Bosea sp. NBC_00550]